MRNSIKIFGKNCFLFLLCKIIMFPFQLAAQENKASLISDVIDLGVCRQDSLFEKGFEALMKKFAGKRIILLDEQDHGVGTDYQNLAFFVKFMHEKMGFNVLAEEFCFYSFGKMNEETKKGKSTQHFRHLMYWPQGGSNELDQLLGYIKEQEHTLHPLQLEGFDSRIINHDFDHFADSIIKGSRISFSISGNYNTYLHTITHALKYEYEDTVTLDQMKQFISQTDSIIDQLRIAHSEARNIQLFRNLEGFVKNSWNFSGTKEWVERYKEREKQMAENLIWLAEVAYPNEKIIVRMHNRHGAKHLEELVGALPDSIAKNALSVGMIINEKFGEQCLHLATTAYQGTFCDYDYVPVNIPTVVDNSLENVLHKKGFKYAYIDLTTKRDIPFYMFYFNFNVYLNPPILQARYGRMFDGIIYMDQVSAATKKSKEDCLRDIQKDEHPIPATDKKKRSN
jgi:erythromycin esterase